jgi:hypothetical protein
MAILGLAGCSLGSSGNGGWSLRDGAVVCPSLFAMTQVMVAISAQGEEVHDWTLNQIGCTRADHAAKLKIIDTTSYGYRTIARIQTAEGGPADYFLYVFQQDLK